MGQPLKRGFIHSLEHLRPSLLLINDVMDEVE
jgi:hypothetical protein